MCSREVFFRYVKINDVTMFISVRQGLSRNYGSQKVVTFVVDQALMQFHEYTYMPLEGLKKIFQGSRHQRATPKI